MNLFRSVGKPIPRQGDRRIAVILGDPRLPDAVKIHGKFDSDDLVCVTRLKAALNSIDGYSFTYYDDHSTLLLDLLHNAGIDLALNLCDNGYQNDARREGDIPAMLGILGIPYTGATPGCLHLCYDKRVTKTLAADMDIPVPRGWTITGNDISKLNGATVNQSHQMIVKPAAADNSVGITRDSLAHDDPSLCAAIHAVRSIYQGDILVEEFMPGADCTVSLVGGHDGAWRSFDITEDCYDALSPDLPRICGYEAKWDATSPYANIITREAEIPTGIAATMIGWSKDLATKWGCRDYCRVDWRLDCLGEPHLLECNPNPGWSWDSHWIKAAQMSGLDYAEALLQIIKSAEDRLSVGR